MTVLYRAKEACRFGGAFRRVDDEFEGPELDEVPAHLEVVSAPEVVNLQISEGKVSGIRKSKVPKASFSGPGPAEITLEPPQNLSGPDGDKPR